MTTLYDVMILVKKLGNPDSDLEIFQTPMPDDEIPTDAINLPTVINLWMDGKPYVFLPHASHLTVAE